MVYLLYKHHNTWINRGSYMSAHVLLNLLNELRKEIKCEAYQTFYLFFATSLINSIIQEHECYILFIINIKITLKSHFCHKNVIIFFIMYAMLLWMSKCFSKICKPPVVYRFYCIALFHSQTRRHMVKKNIVILVENKADMWRLISSNLK